MPKLILDQVRKRKGIGKRELARRVGVKYENSTRWYVDGYDAKWSTICAWARALGVRVRDLYRE